ncbi:MAG: hypothetical protein ROR55_28755 [Devosia sp.]
MKLPFTGTSVARDLHGPLEPSSRPEFQDAVRHATKPTDQAKQARTDTEAFRVQDPAPKPPPAPEAGDPTRFAEIRAAIKVQAPGIDRGYTPSL